MRIKLLIAGEYEIIQMQNQQQAKDQELVDTRTFYYKKYNTEKCIERYSYMLIRPPRFIYNQVIIDPKRKFKGSIEHTVFHIPFPLSLFAPRSIKYVMLYLHGNSSSRYEGFSQLQLLPPDVALACFDFSGCGNRTERKFISLGKNESKEVDIAVKFLKERGFKVALWGRSMGAVSALLSQQAEVVIADSAFSSLYGTCKELSKTQVCAPLHCFFQCLFPCFFCVVSRDVQEKSAMHPKEMQIKDHLKNSNKNRHILLLAATGDKMIHYSHSQILYDSFPGQNKKILVFEGTHNSDRPRNVLDQIFIFAQNALISQQQSVKIQHLDQSKKVQVDSHQCIKHNSERLGMQTKSQLQLPQMLIGMGRHDKTQLVQLKGRY